MKNLKGKYDAEILHKLGAVSVWVHPPGVRDENGWITEYEGDVDISKYEETMLMMAKERKIALIKAKASARILENYPLWRQLNYVRTQNTKLEEMSIYIESIRSASDTVEDKIKMAKTVEEVEAIDM